tara:strand:+ start:4559 stop:5446 length:888 start_codon:yes stop_codon:yes gene_type:complete
MTPLMTKITAVEARQMIGIANRLRSENVGISLKEGICILGNDPNGKSIVEIDDEIIATDWWCVANQDAMDNRELNIRNKPDLFLCNYGWKTFKGMNNAKITKKEMIDFDLVNRIWMKMKFGTSPQFLHQHRVVMTGDDVEWNGEKLVDNNSDGVFTIEDKNLKNKLKHLKKFAASQTEYLIENNTLTLKRQGTTDSTKVGIDIKNPNNIERKGTVEAFRLDQLSQMPNWVSNNSTITVDIQPVREWKTGTKDKRDANGNIISSEPIMEKFGFWWLSLKTSVSGSNYGLRLTMRYD